MSLPEGVPPNVDGIPLAGTSVLLRDGREGVEVLMMERPQHGFFGGAWVFPGGKVEPGDGDDEVSSTRRAAARETWEEVGLTVDPDALVPLSLWEPPPTMPKRIRTWFYLGADPEGEMTPSADEVKTLEWVRPAELLEAHERGSVLLFPPTWITLFQLREARDSAETLAAVREFEVYRTRTVPRDDGLLILWHGDAGYDAIDPSLDGGRHRLHAYGRPWRFERDF